MFENYNNGDDDEGACVRIWREEARGWVGLLWCDVAGWTLVLCGMSESGGGNVIGCLLGNLCHWFRMFDSVLCLYCP